ncbi:right-handed parallel beta-helix repeat-containing protein [Streptomyces sp. NPDC004546]|uniref:right-handed parallel beta-helix repeat-containing protein n=1 Tax=unclassified Streptomyces TaxID=2593676 RepID=UPI0033AAA8B3
MVKRFVVAPRGRWGTYPDIGSALRAAAGRRGPARVEIEPGHYPEFLTVRGEVELAARGEPGSVVVNPARGTALDAAGSVVVRGLELVGRDADVVDLHAGTLVLDRVAVRAHGGVCLHARRDTAATLTDSEFRYGRVLFAGATGSVERCRFTDAADNALAVIESGRVALRDSRFTGSRIHGVRVSDARAELTGCQLSGTGQAAVCADTRAEMTVTDCVITAVQAEAVLFTGQSRGLMRGCRVSDAEHGVAATTGSDPVVRDCVFTDCRDTGINVADAGLGTFEDCEVIDARTVSVFVTRGGAPAVSGCRIVGGNVGVAVVDKSRGRFRRIDVENLPSVALRVREGSSAVFEDVRVERCTAGLETQGDAGTTAEVTGGRFQDCTMGSVAAGGQSRVTVRGVTARRGVVGFAVVEESTLRVHDCEIAEMGMGVLAIGRTTLFARNLAVTGPDGPGLGSTDSAYLDVAGSRFTDCGRVAVSVQGTSGGRLVDCSVTGAPGGMAVQHNGRVDLVSLDSSLRVAEQFSEPAAPPPATVVNNFNAPVFTGAITHSQVAFGNTHVIQQQTTQDGAGS